MSEGTVNQVLDGEKQWAVVHGECPDALAGIPDRSIDSVVTDPPAGVAFMSRDWDKDKGGRDAWISWLAGIMREAFRVLKPGGYVVAWALPRTSHWTAMALEDAGFEIRDSVSHIFASGFPKSVNVSVQMASNGYACVCDVRSGDHTPDEIPVEEQDLLEGVRSETVLSDQDRDTQDSSGHLPRMRQGVSPKEQRVDGESEVLQPFLPGKTLPTDIGCASTQGVLREDGCREGKLPGEDERFEEPRLEGRGNGLQEAWELCPNHLRQVPGGVHGYGTEGWVRDGAPDPNGDDHKTSAGEGRSGASRRPQPEKQPSGKPGTVAEQSPPQASRSWRRCDRCGKSIIPAGYGTALKPSHEVWWIARKPMEGTLAANLLANGCGALNIDGCRVAHAGAADLEQHAAGVAAIKARGGSMSESWKNASDLSGANDVTSAGRWPPNTVFSHAPGCRRVGTRTVAANPTWDTPNRDTEPSAFTGETVSRVRHGRAGQPSAERRYDEAGSTSFAPLPGDRRDVEDVEVWECVDGCAAKALGEMSSGGGSGSGEPSVSSGTSSGYFFSGTNRGVRDFGDSGTATRFFPQFSPDYDVPFKYAAKPARSEKERGLQHFRRRSGAEATGSQEGQARLESPRTGGGRTGGVRNVHPTPKGIELLRWLTRLATPRGGTVLDLFAGSGTGGIAAVLEGFRWIGIEMNDTDAEPFVSIARARLTHIDGGEFIPRESLRAPVNERPKQVTLFG